MKLFNLGRGNDLPAPDAVGEPEEDLHEGEEPQEEGPDVAEILDASMRQFNDRISRMSTTLDSVSQDRKAFEAKLGEMDERMRKLSMLTEMISNRYNPFIGSEYQPSATPAGAPGGRAASHGAASGHAAASAAAPVREGAAPPAAGPDAPRLHFPPIHEPAAPKEAWPRLPEPVLPPAPGWARDPDVAGTPAEFAHQLGVLALAEHLLAATSRVGALEVLGYYERLGWIGAGLRRELLIAMEGLPAKADPAESKASYFLQFPAEFHVRSLALIHRTRGSRLSEEDIAALRRELARFQGG